MASQEASSTPRARLTAWPNPRQVSLEKLGARRRRARRVAGMPGSEFMLSADDGQSLLARRWLPEGRPRAVLQIAHGLTEHSARYARLAAALNAAGYGVYANDHARPRARGRARRPRPFRRRGRLGQGGRRPLDPQPPDRGRAAGNANRLARPFAGLVPRPRVYRRPFRRARWRRPFGLERQAADDRDARAPHRPRGAAALGQAGQKRPRLPNVVRRLQQAVQARAHPVRLAVARREGGRRLCRRSPLRLSVHDPARNRRARRTPPCHEPREPRPHSQGPADLCLLRRARSGRAPISRA